MKEQIVTATGTEPVTPANITGEPVDHGRELSASLPRDHPAWQRDVLSISARARELLARLHPIAVRVLTFWDHVRRAATVAGRTLEIDPSGSYRLR
ncbi:MAG TPA: hypothetical protein VHS78_19020 [Candidatus Elarobacter sp.]|jgi:hypothetical protein|nr:hypothetical protein [Candidatus Elarobacter sp.]